MKIKVLDRKPEIVFERMKPVVKERDMPEAANAIGHITYREVVDA